jgi:hypothetical protein
MTIKLETWRDRRCDWCDNAATMAAQPHDMVRVDRACPDDLDKLTLLRDVGYYDGAPQLIEWVG